jgi:1,2-diacylglycerol 3-alpha-glucosyltransferase
MRIMMLSHGYPPTISGVTLVVQKIARAMVQRGHEVCVLTASDREVGYRDEDQGVKLIRVHSTTNPFWHEGPLPIILKGELERITQEFKPDVINTHDSAFFSLQLIRMNSKIQVPEVLTCHYVPRFVTHFLNWGDSFENLIETLTWEYSIHMINRFDHVTFPTESQQEAFIKEGLRSDSTVISNGVDTKRYHPGSDDRRDLEEKYALPDGPRILFVGRLAKDKEIDVLIRAMQRIWREEKAHLLIVGRGDDRANLEALVDRLGLDACVHFLGFVPEEDLPALYRRVDLFTIVSDSEVQSIPTLQAVASGLPVVAADAGALPELAQDGRNGFLVPPDDVESLEAALLKIIRNPQTAEDFSRASLVISEKHKNECTFRSYEKLYQNLKIRQGRLIQIPSVMQCD